MNSESRYESLIEPHEPQMMQSVWRIAQNADDADEAIQDACTKIWQRLEQIEAHPNPRALILRICIHAALDVKRRQRRKQPETELPEWTDEGVDAGSKAVESVERREAVTRAVLALPQQQATAVAMRHLMGRDYLDIAAALDCSEATARVHVSRGLAKLRSLLAEYNPTILDQGGP